MITASYSVLFLLQLYNLGNQSINQSEMIAFLKKQWVLQALVLKGKQQW